MSLRTTTSPKNVSVLTKFGKAARSKIAQIGLAAGLSVIAYSANAEAQERPGVCVPPSADGGVAAPCPGGTELPTGPRPRVAPRPRPRPDACGDSGAHSPVTNVDTYLRDPVIQARIARVHPGLDIAHGAVYTISVPVSVSRLTWDEARAEPRTDTRTLAANTRVYGVRVNDAGAYDANGHQIRLVLDTSCGDVVNGTVSIDNASVPVSTAEPVRDAGTVDASADASADTSGDTGRREEPSRVRDDIRTTGDDPTEGRAADAYAPPPPSERTGYVELTIGGGVLLGTRSTTDTRTVDTMSPVSSSLRITASNPSPELSGMGPTGRFIVVLTVSGGTGPYTISIPGAEVTDSSGGNAFNVIGRAGTYTATVTDNAGRTSMMSVEINGTRVTASDGSSIVTGRTTERVQTDYHTILLPSIALMVGARPTSDRRFDIAGGIEASFGLEERISRDALGRVLNSGWGLALWDLNLQARLAGVLGDNYNWRIGGLTRVHFVPPLQGVDLALFADWSSNGRLDAPSFIIGLDAGIHIPFDARAGAWTVNPAFNLRAGVRF